MVSTIFELQKLSVGLRFLVNGELPSYYEVPAQHLLVGTRVGLTPALWFELGHPGIGNSGLSTMVYAWATDSWHLKRNIVLLEATFAEKSVRGIFETEEIIRFADEIYDEARRLEKRFIKNKS